MTMEKKVYNQSEEFEASDSPYQYTRTIRFLAKADKQTESFKRKINVGSADINLSDLSNKLLDFYQNLNEIIYFNKDFSKKLYIKKTWLKRWHKDAFYLSIKDETNKQGKYSISQDLKEIHDSLRTKINTWEEYSKRLKDASNSPQESQFRRSEIANAISELMNIRILPYLIDFFEEISTKDPSLDNRIKKIKDNLKDIQENLKKAEEKYLSSQSIGIEIAKSSFNYYTVNKKPKERHRDYLKDSKDKLFKEKFSTIKKTNNNYNWRNNSNEELFKINSTQEKEWMNRYFNEEKERIEKNSNASETLTLSLDETHIAMKTFKSEQKSIFYELATHIVSGRGGSYTVKNESHLLKGYEIGSNQELSNWEFVNRQFSLFNFSEEKYKEIIKCTKKIKNGENNYRLKRGRILSELHKSECKDYEGIAKERGRLIAKIKGIEKENLDALQIEYWSLIYCNKNKKQIWLIPKKSIQDAKNYIKNIEKNNIDSSQHLYYFKSLTMRALDKLCFAEESSFIRDMKDEEIKSLQIDAKESSNIDSEGNATDRKSRKKLEFFKKLLKSTYAQETLDLEDFDLQLVLESGNLNTFEKELEKACYVPKRIFIASEKKEEFLSKFNVTTLDITSYDLERKNKNSENKLHTELWDRFWNNINSSNKNKRPIKGFKMGDIRINPEAKVHYRKSDESLKIYMDRKFDPSFKHRNLNEQFIISFTLSINAGNKYEDIAFSKPEDVLNKINNFNRTLNRKLDFQKSWKYGIDRGINELATLCLVKFSPKCTYTYNNTEVPQPSFPNNQEIKCYELKKEKYTFCKKYTNSKGEEKKRKAIENLSYFIDDKDLFHKKQLTCLDLTIAKVIKGIIVTNGDVMTYLKFKKLLAKRDIFKIEKIAKNSLFWSKRKDGKDEEKFFRPEGVLNINTTYGEKTIYEYIEKYKDLLSKDDIKNSLSAYINSIQRQDNTHTPSIIEINNLRKAIVSNMIGVICFLQKKYPGFIFLEHLAESNRAFSTVDNVHRKLENALYNKFQSFGMIPPHINNIIELREKYHDRKSQIGTVVFVAKENTSKNCPYCEKTNNENSFKDMKYRQKRFLCQKCHFDTYAFIEDSDKVENYTPQVDKISKQKQFNLFKDINDPDKVAAYNIAKVIKCSTEINELKLNKAENKKSKNISKKKNIMKKSNKNLTHTPFAKLSSILKK